MTTLFTDLPTCHHCQALAPTWQKLAERYSGRQDVVIGEMDGGENDVNIRQLHSKAYPTMLFYPKGKREVSGTVRGVLLLAVILTVTFLCTGH